MTEYRLFPEDTIPEYTTSEWYAGRERAPHLEQPGHRERLLLAIDMVKEAICTLGVISVIDLGAGDGGLLSVIQPLGVPCWGHDLQQTNVDGARERGVDVRLGDAISGDIEWADLAVITECLEHLIDPHQAVRRIAEHSRVIVASSPDHETDVAHYEFHTWAWDLKGYAALIEQGGFEVVRHEQTHGSQVIMGVRT